RFSRDWSSDVCSSDLRAVLDRISGMMSLLEGHGDVTMDRAGADRIPSADRFSRVLRVRRQQTTTLVRLLQKLVGLEAKLNQYERSEERRVATDATSKT